MGSGKCHRDSKERQKKHKYFFVCVSTMGRLFPDEWGEERRGRLEGVLGNYGNGGIWGRPWKLAKIGERSFQAEEAAMTNVGRQKEIIYLSRMK